MKNVKKMRIASMFLAIFVLVFAFNSEAKATNIGSVVVNPAIEILSTTLECIYADTYVKDLIVYNFAMQPVRIVNFNQLILLNTPVPITINLDNLPSGTYFVGTTKPSGENVSKLVQFIKY